MINPTVVVRIKPELRDALQAAADAERRTLGAYLRIVIEDHVASLAKRKKK
jgi:hypothetical protein